MWALGAGACASATVATPGLSLSRSPLTRAGDGPALPSVVRPRRPGAADYGAPAWDELRASIIPDPLRALVLDRVRGVARSLHRTEPVRDARVDALAEDLAWGLRGTETPTAETTDFLAQYYGLVEPGPQVSIIRASGKSDAELAGYVADQLGEIMKVTAPARVGVGVQRQPEELVLVVALQEKNVEVMPVPRRMGPAAAVHLEGRLLGNYTHPEVVVTLPDGQVRELPAGTDAAGVAFRANVTCDRGPGRYQIEVGGSDALGPAIRANFPVYCGMAPPAAAPVAMGTTHVGPWTAAEAEAVLLKLVNRDRLAARLAPLLLDRKLSDVARAHSQDMADHDFVGHISPTTGGPDARVRRAGFQPAFLAENAGLDSSPDSVHAGLMNSPGHRGNILERHATRIGIGVVWKKSSTGADVLLVTELFM